jgi:hypothetical protein
MFASYGKTTERGPFLMKRNVIIVLGILIIGVLAYFPFRRYLEKEAIVLTSYVLLLTLIAVLVYSLETRGLRKISAEHLELSFKPHLLLIFKENRRFYLYNIGNGPAVKIRIDDAIIEFAEGISIHLKFVAPPVLKKDEWLPIGINLIASDREREASAFELGFVTPPAATKTISIIAHFQNLIGKDYETPLKLGQGMDEGTSISPH